MPLSFWLFLLASVIALIYTIWDHAEVWDEFQRSTYPKRIGKLLKLICLWAMPLIFLAATIFSGLESKDSDRQFNALTTSVGGFSNKLNWANAALSFQSNRVSRLETTIRSQSNALAAVKIKPLKERIIDCLNRIDPKIVIQMRANGQAVNLKGVIPDNRCRELQSLSEEKGADEYMIFRPATMTGFGSGTEMSGMADQISMDFLPTLVK